jgi:hypothetical protein
VNENVCRANAIHRLTRVAKDKYRQVRSIERNLLKEKSRQLDEVALIEIGRHRSKFYKRLNDVKRPFDAQELLTNKDQVLSMSKEHFKQNLSEGEERDQPPDQVNLRDDGVDIEP